MSAARATDDRRSRRVQILDVAAELFARNGFHGVSIDGIGAAVGISGPALYRHFRSKEDLLAQMLVGISETLLEGARERARDIGEPRRLLASLVEFHTEFALTHPELITVHDRDLANLPEGPRRQVRVLQRAYVEIWVATLRLLRPALAESETRVVAHAAFGLMNSTPRSAASMEPALAAPLLRAMVSSALWGATPQAGG